MSLHSPIAKTAARVRTPIPERVDVAIIGAGPGGLMAGAILARSGLKVAIFDQHYVAGGCATMFERGRSDARWRFDVGLHYIGDCGPDGKIPTLLRQVGVTLDYAPLDPDGFDTIVLPGMRFRIPVGHEKYRQRLYEYFPKEKKGIDRYVQLLLEIDRTTRKMDSAGGKLGFGMALDTLLHGRMLIRYQNATIAQVLDDCTQDKALRAVLLGQSGDYGVPPSQASALLHCGLANHYFHGAYYPKGGGQAIADSLADTIETAGGTVHLRCGIAQVVIEDGKAVGVLTEAVHGVQHRVAAKLVLSNADLKATLLQLVGQQHLPDSWVQKADHMQMGGALFLSCFGLQGTPAVNGLSATNFWQFDDYDAERFYTDAAAGEMPRGCYVTSGTAKDPTTPGHAPEGMTGVEVMALSAGKPQAWGVTPESLWDDSYRKNPKYLAKKQAVEDDLLRRLDVLCPGTAGRVVFKESATPLTHTRFTRATDGTGYGLAAIPSQFMRNRPGYRGPLANLYLCGASTRAGHGIVGAMMSGEQSAKRILADLAVVA